MSGHSRNETPARFWSIVWLLLKNARKRYVGRQKRQQELMRHRARRKSTWQWSWLGLLFGIVLMSVLNGGAAYVVYGAVTAGQQLEIEQQGKIIVSGSFYNAVVVATSPQADADDFRTLEQNYQSEARYMAREYGGSEEKIESMLRNSVRQHESRDFIQRRDASLGLRTLPHFGHLPAMLGSLVLFWWSVMLLFQGEGLELDLQRRRHPMWEWLFSHPVSPGAVFTAEMLSPIIANPVYCTAPLFVGVLYGFIYGIKLGIIAAFAVGIPIAMSAAFAGKALETLVVLRLAPRSRGAMVGLMSWIGYTALILFFFGGPYITTIATMAGKFLLPLTAIPWPWLGLFLGQSGDSFSFTMGVLWCWCASGLIMLVAVSLSVWSTQRGLGGSFGKADSAPAPAKGGVRFGKKPLYRKEYLWFIRDRSAIVQTILMPLTICGFQLFNFRGLLGEVQDAWNYLCGAGILFGTYFLWILGPKSLASEGTALWIALTWPQGLENLLKAKAWLWSMISSVIVGLVLIYAAYLFPGNLPEIMLVGVGWFFFGRSMAEKAVTLVRVPSSSGEPEKISRNRQWAASLGMLTFSVGILTQQWHIAIMGIVYSYITAAAMWENFRARLPYLYDPWSEILPRPPTLMHAMVAISILVELGAILTAGAMQIFGKGSIATIQVVIYGVCAFVVSLFVSRFLSNRGVSSRDIWIWQSAEVQGALRKAPLLTVLAIGVAGGSLLGLFAHAYLALLHYIPSIAEMMRQSRMEMDKIPNLRLSYSIMAVAFAPLAEEYLFRGLLFRALDREWGGWKAIFGSAAFFIIYHPVLAWVPVGLLGIGNAWLFKKTGRLAPAVIMHTVYNLVVLS